ncbi:EGF-like domain [Nesidiocoris tenuis]|uniref:EGF-like domain n=1 Tax=Nesidiocoris tenuis TaxID=355587 RepID=A0ABN7B4T7_9HEMI|nr:EGF-like domain [Nesidiocoris tenuis]
MESRRSSSRSGSGINGSGGRLRRQRSSEWREYSTSEEEATARQTAVYAAGIASLLANYTRDGYCDGDEPPVPPSYRQGISPTRQASPYPIENTNLTSGSSTPNPSLSPRFGRSVAAERLGAERLANGNGSKKSNSKCNTLGGRSRTSGNGSKRGVTSSSSVSSASSDNLHRDNKDRDRESLKQYEAGRGGRSDHHHHHRLDEPDIDSPPEPAPPEVPPRGPSLQHPLQASSVTLDSHDPANFVYPNQETPSGQLGFSNQARTKGEQSSGGTKRKEKWKRFSS